MFSVIARIFCSRKIGDRARIQTPAADVTALRMRFPKDRTFVFDVEYSYRVDDVFTDFVQVRFTLMLKDGLLPNPCLADDTTESRFSAVVSRADGHVVFHPHLLPNIFQREETPIPNTHGRIYTGGPKCPFSYIAFTL